MNKVMEVALEDPDIYAAIRLNIELQNANIETINDGLDLELALYELKPTMIKEIYRTPDHLLAYISAVRGAYDVFNSTGKLPDF
jgi:hypothetical protein